MKQRNRIGSAMAIVASSGMAVVALGLVAAPSAAADPAPQKVERTYLHVLNAAGINVGGQEGQALQLAYLSCALKKSTGQIIDGTAPFLGAAKVAGLCDYAGSGITLADARQQLQTFKSQSEAPTIAGILNTDADHDGFSDSNDSAPYYDGEH